MNNINTASLKPAPAPVVGLPPPDVTLRTLLGRDCKKVEALHRTVLRDLEERGLQSFFLPKTPEQLRACLSNGHGVTVGAYAGPELVGVSTLTFPRQESDVALVALPEGITLHQLCEVRSTAVHPKHRGRGINRRMLAALLEVWRPSHPRKVLVSEFEVRNIASWKTSVAFGLVIEYTAVDPDDGARLMYGVLRRDRAGEGVGGRALLLHPDRQWPDLQAALRDGYRGVNVTPDGRLVCRRAANA